MGFWQIAEWAGWLVSAAIFVWMLWDGFRVGHHYNEELLQSSREGVDEILEHGDRVRS